MHRLWIWIPPLALACAIPLQAWHGLQGFPPPWSGATLALEYLALGYFLDRAVLRTCPGTPLYRRHLTLFLLLMAFGCIHAAPSALASRWSAALIPSLISFLGSALGLALSCLPALKGRQLACLSWHRGEKRRARPSNPLILVADPHWSDDLTGLREAETAWPQADWLFLGDVFDAWVGLPGLPSPTQTAFLDWVAGRRKAGCWVGLWMGNREFFLDPLSNHFDLLGEGTGGGLPQEGLAWEHGDLVNASDWRYRLWNLVSRSSPMYLFARALPRSTAQALTRWLHRSLRTTNRAYKLKFPREAFRRAAAEHEGKIFLTGHFHTYEQEGNGIALPWAHEGQFMVWRDGSVKQLELNQSPH